MIYHFASLFSCLFYRLAGSLTSLRLFAIKMARPCYEMMSPAIENRIDAPEFRGRK